MASASSALDTLLEAAILAPSGDNTQPWSFRVEREGPSILMEVNPARDPSPMNAGQGMARISLGAALENMVRTAERNGWGYRIDYAQPDSLVRCTLEAEAPAGTIDELLSRRVTNRRVYEGTPLPPDCVSRLNHACAAFGTARTLVITNPMILTRLVSLIARGDALILGNKSIRNAFLEKVRFDKPVREEVTEGLSLGSLEVALPDRISLRMMHTLPPPDGLLRLAGARRVFARLANRLAASASGMCLITSTGNSEVDDIHVGRAWQNMWLRFTEEELAAQPMMSLLVLQNIIQNKSDVLSERDSRSARTLLQQFYELIGEMIEGRPAALMRFGIAKPPTSRVKRLPIRSFIAASR